MRFYRTSVGKYFILVSLGSIIMLGLILTALSSSTVKQMKKKDTAEYLNSLAKNLIYVYELSDDTGLGFSMNNGRLMIGDEAVGSDSSIVDHLKDITGAEYTIFVGGKRICTTIKDDTGQRYINTYNNDIWNEYARVGKSCYLQDVEINGNKYWGYYLPLRTQEGFSVGMVFAGMPSQSISVTIRNMEIKMAVIMIFISVIAICAVIYAVRKLLRMQTTITNYMMEIDRGEFAHEMPKWIISRDDEYGRMSRMLVSLSESLDGRVQKDGLTGLYNRSAAMHHLKKYFVEANSPDGRSFTFAIGDIDFFKKVNDTYGHNCGDEVLKRVAAVMRNNMQDAGFVARWGGEEFILVFKGKLGPAQEKLEKIAQEIRDTVVVFDDYEVKVTMTFGMVQYHSPNNLDYVISKADKLLYKGKENGRNQIVS